VNSFNQLEFHVDFENAPGHRGQIMYTQYEAARPEQCNPALEPLPATLNISPDATFEVSVLMLDGVPGVQAEIFIQQVEDWKWFAGRDSAGNPSDLNPGDWTTIRTVQWVTGIPPVSASWSAGQEFITVGVEFKIKEGTPLPSGVVRFAITPICILVP